MLKISERSIEDLEKELHNMKIAVRTKEKAIRDRKGKKDQELHDIARKQQSEISNSK